MQYFVLYIAVRNDNLKSITLYVTAIEYQQIRAEADQRGISISQLMRLLINEHSSLALPPLPPRGAPRGDRNGKRKSTKKNTPDLEST
ncbi:MAG TPA: hypothetical protein PKZ53_24625 [Acidobacteriota bacterium]|nr:hypothetical protein [Acidobacteriota bacterium]